MKVSANLGLENVIIEGDAMNVINALKGDDRCLEWQGRNSILHGRQLLSRHALWAVYHTHQDRNRAAHTMAKWAKSQQSFGLIDPVLLPFCIL